MFKRILSIAGLLTIMLFVQTTFSEKTMDQSMHNKHGMDMKMDMSNCPRCGNMMEGMHDKRNNTNYNESMNLEDHFFDATKTVLSEQEEIKLTEKQKFDIMKLKMNVKRDVLRKNVEIEILKMDIHAGLMEDKIDAKNIKGLMRKASSLKDELSDILVDAIISFNATLNAEQIIKLKKIMM